MMINLQIANERRGRSEDFTLKMVKGLLFVFLFTGWDSSSALGSVTTDEQYARLFFSKYCSACHSGEKVEANFRIDESLETRFQDPSMRGRWAEIVDVLNSHEMPPEDATQPIEIEIAEVVDWITERTVEAEMSMRENRVVMRRLNRLEYQHTIRDLTGVEFDTAGFPQDPPASGFDNVGSSLSLSPMQLELYFDAAQKILEEAIPTREKPESIQWRFQIDSGDSDSNRVRIENQSPIVNGGNNPVWNGFKRVHHASWDKVLNVRDFSVKTPGRYRIRFRAAGKVPNREEVVESAEKILRTRLESQIRENPKGREWHERQFETDLKHFKSDWIYRYGPPRAKVVVSLGGQPKTVGEFDIDAPLDSPNEYEVEIDLTTQNMGVNVEYAYEIPKVLENFWMQNGDEFARPELFVDWIEVQGPIVEGWPPKSQTLVLPYPLADDQDDTVSEVNIGKFVRRAFRRPVRRDEVKPYLDLYTQSRKRGESPKIAYQHAMAAVLVSPHFLFLVESPAPPSPSGHPTRLNDYQLASRLSYFLWSSMPDDDLMNAANGHELTQAGVMRREAERMLNDNGRSDRMVQRFADQWLSLRDVGSNPPASDLYPHYDRHLETSMIEESRSLFRTILREKRNLLDFLDADYVVINERLARFYEIENVVGDHFRVVATQPQHHRGGILTQASMLVVTSNGTRTSPVKRGTWILKNVLGTDPGLPVANAGDIAPKVPGIDKATVRQRLEIHRQLPQCARCHNKIDPLGLALENYDASGQYREQEGFGYKGRIEKEDPRIDATAKLPDGTMISGVADLKTKLRSQETRFLNCLAEKLLVYATGRELTLADKPTLNRIVEQTRERGYLLEEMIYAVIESDPFQSY